MTLDVSCSYIKGRVDQGVRTYLFIEEEREVTKKLQMMKKLLKGNFQVPKLEVVASEKTLVNIYIIKISDFISHFRRLWVKVGASTPEIKQPP